MTTEKIPGWIERLLLPKLSEISGDVKALDIKIESLRNETKTEINSVRNEISGVRKEIESLRIEMNVKFDSLEKRIPVIEKMVALNSGLQNWRKGLLLRNFLH